MMPNPPVDTGAKYMPTPEEIRQKCQEIRAGWSVKRWNQGAPQAEPVTIPEVRDPSSDRRASQIITDRGGLVVVESASEG